MSAFSFLHRKAAEGPTSTDITDGGKVVLPNSAEGRKFFRKRSIFIVILAVGFIAINALSGAAVDFDFIAAVLDFPSAIVWMATNFIPTVESLEKSRRFLARCYRRYCLQLHQVWWALFLPTFWQFWVVVR